MSDKRKKPGVAFWATVVAVVVLVVYPLSIGPAARLNDRGSLPDWAVDPVESFYAPVYWLCGQSEWSDWLLEWYLDFWSTDFWPTPFTPNGSGMM